MAKKEDKQPKPNFFRIAIFIALAGGLIWLLSSQVEIGSQKRLEKGQSKVKGKETFKSEKSSVGEEKSSQQKVIEKVNKEIERLIPGVVEKVVKKEVEKINQRFYQQGDEVIKNTEQIIRETKLAEEIEKIIFQATDELEGFPEKQKKDLKREAIKQVRETLMKEVENDQSQE